MNTKWQYLKAKKKFVYTYSFLNRIHANFARIQIAVISESLSMTVLRRDNFLSLFSTCQSKILYLVA